MYEYPIESTFGLGVRAPSDPLVCPEGSTRTPDGLGCCTVNREGYQVCGEYAPATDIGHVSLGLRGATTVDSVGFTLCIHGGTRAATGEPFFAGSVVPWPWGEKLDCPILGGGDAASEVR